MASNAPLPRRGSNHAHERRPRAARWVATGQWSTATDEGLNELI